VLASRFHWLCPPRHRVPARPARPQ
jgi:hypothetical protein